MKIIMLALNGALRLQNFANVNSFDPHPYEVGAIVILILIDEKNEANKFK